MHTLGLRRLPTLPMAIMILASALPVSYARAEPRATEFTLSNGMDVVVIPDHRAPVVTHMVWYKVGAADDPPGKSGIAHFLEHLMFKGTAASPLSSLDMLADCGAGTAPGARTRSPMAVVRPSGQSSQMTRA